MYCVVANVIKDTVLRDGAKVQICSCNGDGERPIVRGLNKRGRNIHKFVHFKNLTNFRASFLHRLPSSYMQRVYETREEADAVATNLNSV